MGRCVVSPFRSTKIRERKLLWCRVILGKMIVAQLVKTFHQIHQFPVIYVTRMFITVFTRARHRSLSCAAWIQYTFSNSILNIYFNIILLYAKDSQVVSSHQVFRLKFCMHLWFPHVCYVLSIFYHPWFDHANIWCKIKYIILPYFCIGYVSPNTSTTFWIVINSEEPIAYLFS
jgi:hypothetical protein